MLRGKINLFSILFLSSLLHAELCNMENVAQKHGLSYTYESNHVQLSKRGYDFSFSVNSKEAKLNGVKVFLTYPIVAKSSKKPLFLKRNLLQKTQVFIDSVDVQKILFPLLSPKTIYKKTNKIIVIDPGHGGKADGAICKHLNLKEKTLTLKTAQKLASKLKSIGYSVFLTRTKDVDLSLEARSNFANAKGASIFISLHYNSAAAKQASGIETFSFSFANHPSTDHLHPTSQDRTVGAVNKFDTASTYLAWQIQKQLILKTHSQDRGMRRGRMGVLRNLKCPGVLIECGFISNPKDANTCNTPAYQEKLVTAISSGIQNYFSL